MYYVSQKYVQLSALQKQKYTTQIKEKFQKELAKSLQLQKVQAPLVVTRSSGLQDDLSGTERVVGFDILKDGSTLEIVQSLAKWKRLALKQYDFDMHTGLYTDMSAIRRDDKMDQTHSIYVDQWDWEKVILPQDRTLTYLKKTVKKIVLAVYKTAKLLEKLGFKSQEISKDVFFITSEQLLKLYPHLTPKQREYQITKKYKTVFIMQIGDALSDGKPHDTRAPDYDDWSLDGDLMYYHEVLDCALEISSMGIRVDKKALMEQIKKADAEDKLKCLYHKQIIEDKLPLSIGGGIGQSRLCQLLLGRAHIGEVQASYWDALTLEECKTAGIELL